MSVSLLVDAGLPGLSRALDAEAMTPLLAGLLPPRADAAWRVANVEVLKHKPGRRCSLAYLLVDGDRRLRLFAKTFARERGASIVQNMGTLAEAIDREALIIPRPLGYLPEIRLMVTEFVEGEPLATALYRGESEVAARRMAAALARIHASDAPFARRWSAHREMANTGEWLSGLSASRPDLLPAAQRLLERLGGEASALPVPPLVPVHRDFYADQLWDCSGCTALLDLDDVRRGDPALDAGNFLAHLSLRSAQFPDVAAGCGRGRPAFLQEYGERRSGAPGMESFAARLRFYEAASLLRLAGVYAGRERWARSLPPILLSACEAALAARG